MRFVKTVSLWDSDSASTDGTSFTGLELLLSVGPNTLIGAGFRLYQAQLLRIAFFRNVISACFF